jgi:hypothetical protein
VRQVPAGRGVARAHRLAHHPIRPAPPARRAPPPLRPDDETGPPLLRRRRDRPEIGPRLLSRKHTRATRLTALGTAPHRRRASTRPYGPRRRAARRAPRLVACVPGPSLGRQLDPSEQRLATRVGESGGVRAERSPTAGARGAGTRAGQLATGWQQAADCDASETARDVERGVLAAAGCWCCSRCKLTTSPGVVCREAEADCASVSVYVSTTS